MPAEPDNLSAEQRIAVNKIKSLMSFWGIAPAELGRAKAAVRTRPPVARAATPKYRHPISGQTWDGVGAQPDWLKTALLKEGYLVEELRAAAVAEPLPR